MQLGQILGAETVKDTQLLVEMILTQVWREQFTSRDMRIMAVSSVTVLFVVILQIGHFIVSRAQKLKFKWWSYALAFAFDIFLFVGMIVAQFYISNFFMQVKAPRAVQYSRAVPQIFSLSYQTYDPQYSIIVWGYDPDHLDFTELGGAAGKKTRRHDFNLAVEPKSTVYFRILVGDELYGKSSLISGEPYQVITDTNNE